MSDPSTVPDPVILARVKKLSDAIQNAEGYNVPGSRPQRNNNPGNLELDITGTGIGKDGPYIVYKSYEDGRAALEHQVLKMFNGTSRIYEPRMTIAAMAQHYTGTQQQAWASNVAKFLGVDVTCQLNEVPI